MIKSRIEARGRIKAWLVRPSGVVVPVVDKFNTLRSELFTSFLLSWTGTNDFALDNLFTEDGTQEIGKDGIILRSTNPSVTNYPMKTTSVSASEVFGAKWQGEFTNGGGSTITMDSAHLGHDHEGDAGFTPWFDLQLADATLPSVVMSSLDRLVVDWEIYT